MKPEAVVFVLFCIAVPEIEQGLSDAAQLKITVSFTPHLMPMVRCLIKLHTCVNNQCVPFPFKRTEKVGLSFP